MLKLYNASDYQLNDTVDEINRNGETFLNVIYKGGAWIIFVETNAVHPVYTDGTPDTDVVLELVSVDPTTPEELTQRYTVEEKPKRTKKGDK